MKEKKLVPKLRFPGFTEPWEQRKLGDLYKRINERNDGTLGRNKWISVAKMYFQDPEKVQSNNLDTRTYVMKKGDIAFEGHPNNEFKFGRFVLNDIGTGIISELFPIYRPITEYDLNFWKYAIQFERVMAPIFAKSITSSGNSSNKLDQNHFLNQTILVPPISEQKEIGAILERTTNLITLHQRKLEHLKLKKKSLLQKLFPKEGEVYPELRFPGFTEPWEQRKLGEVVKSYSGGTPIASNKEYYGGDIPFIRSAEINSDTTELYITQKGLDNSSAKIVEKGTILYAMYGATSGEVGISKINGAINQAILAMIPLDYDGEIISQYLRKNKESIIGKYLQGGQGNLSANIILELSIQLPGLEESNQIAYFLESVDNVITLHQRKLEHLQLLKKALLQQLFV